MANKWGTNPTEFTLTEAEMRAKWAATSTNTHSRMQLGVAFGADGRRVDCAFQPDAAEFAATAASGAHPAILYQKFKDWMVTHEAHQRTHLGHVTSSDGKNANVWFCQKDNAICFDNQT